MSTRECLSPVDKNQFPICWKHSFVSWTRSMTTGGESRGELSEKKINEKSPFSERLTENQCWWRVGSLCIMGVTNVWCDPGLRFSSRVAAAEILHRPGDSRGTRHSQRPSALGDGTIADKYTLWKWPPVSSLRNFASEEFLPKNDSFIGPCLPTGFIIFVR